MSKNDAKAADIFRGNTQYGAVNLCGITPLCELYQLDHGVDLGADKKGRQMAALCTSS
jgi:hypothetical protein